MSESIRGQIRHQLDERGLYNRLLTTEEASEATGLSQYELRLGAKQGRYPVLLIGRDENKTRRMRWNLNVLMDAIKQQMEMHPEEG